MAEAMSICWRLGIIIANIEALANDHAVSVRDLMGDRFAIRIIYCPQPLCEEVTAIGLCR